METKEHEFGLRVGVIGCGNVGSAVCRILSDVDNGLSRKDDVKFVLSAIAVRDLSKTRHIDVPIDILTDDPFEIVSSPDIDVVIEVMGGTELALALIKEALRDGKQVVTANKGLVADHIEELWELAAIHDGDIFYEAAVGGAIPVVRTLQTSLAAEPIRRLSGILNGTTNYMLSSMTDRGLSYEECLSEAQDAGIAESDPEMDVSGIDAAAKAAILGRIAFGCVMRSSDVYCEGIVDLPSIAFSIAQEFDCVIKLLAIVDQSDNDGSVVARVLPMLVQRNHALASVSGSHNAVHVEADWLGDCMLYGMGAGPKPTASAVVGDLLAVASGHASSVSPARSQPGDMSSIASRFCVAIEGIDEPGVLASIDREFASHGIALTSIARRSLGEKTVILITTRPCSESEASRAFRRIRSLDVVDRISLTIRFFDE